ncbi:VapC toxin family PIN domain ribonuclease [Candidatus Woesebacteria bacterium CG07_land_8_20_14_0_80_44_9]|uniref:Ribonuclease VapC n=2 Tax=Candidatus Woeseibacteriota TaxID=1752722 RepID=A0A2M6YDY1_9BACT|nr:MAG: VapC toxin family PIN domain ribonuclease [Candidatus Woesebacteria bacterium CG07_land_8_20_14_0_80_44_9]PIZ45602.1 MAG: VapC toxin family PIN domain ribonuclease [Candidatus Woesebacteria bacterium CG_4_10_14_0_2_um_filter_44_9]
MKLVVDTSILIDKLRGRRKWDSFLENLDGGAELYLPSIVIFELFSGLSSKKAQISLKIFNFRKFFSEIDLTFEIAKRAGEMNRDIAGNLDLPDYIIAATAIEIGAQVVTLNKKHFSKIPGVSVYETS